MVSFSVGITGVWIAIDRTTHKRSLIYVWYSPFPVESQFHLQFWVASAHPTVPCWFRSILNSQRRAGGRLTSTDFSLCFRYGELTLCRRDGRYRNLLSSIFAMCIRMEIWMSEECTNARPTFLQIFPVTQKLKNLLFNFRTGINSYNKKK